MQVKSVKHKSNFTLKTSNGLYVEILSVSKEGQLLVGQRNNSNLHVYSANCSHVTSVKLPDNQSVCDVVWTPRGKIVYTECRSGKVVIMSQSGYVIQETKRLRLRYFVVSTDDVIYVISGAKLVYKSADDGLTWSRMFEVSGGVLCVQVIKVSTDSNTDVFWTVELSAEWCVRMYKLDQRRAVGYNVTWRDITIPSHVTIGLRHCRLAYDGRTSIFVMDFINRAVHVLSVSGHYERQLISRQQLKSHPLRIAIDTQRHVMYVGQDKGLVGVFELKYELM
jgi:hypothetical protein